MWSIPPAISFNPNTETIKFLVVLKTADSKGKSFLKVRLSAGTWFELKLLCMHMCTSEGTRTNLKEKETASKLIISC